MTRTKTLLRALLGVGAAGAIAAFGTFSAFSSTTENPNNKIATGTVVLTDNDGNPGQALIDLSDAKPGQPYDQCIRITYTGSLPATMKMYVPDAIGANGDDLDLEVTPGTVTDPTFKSCTGWATTESDLWGDGLGGNKTLDDFQVAHNAFSNGLGHAPGGTFTNGESQVYRFRVHVRDTAAQNTTTNTFAIKFEAHNT